VQPKLAFLFRPSPGWFLGPVVGATWVVNEGELTRTATELQSALGWIF